MFNSSPITSWEGAGVFYTYAGGAGAGFWVLITAILCIVPLFVAWRAEKAAEDEHG